MGKHSQSIEKTVLERIRDRKRGWVFTPAEFLDLASRDAVDQVLSRATRAGTIRKLARGLYDYPRSHPRLGVLSPSAESVAHAVQSREASRLQPSGAHAANILGLSEQVPVKAVFFTDGRSRNVQIGRQTIVLKRTTPRQLATAGRISGTVIQALRWLGQAHVDEKVVSALRRKLSDKDKRQLLADLPYAPAWIGKILREIAEARPS